MVRSRNVQALGKAAQRLRPRGRDFSDVETGENQNRSEVVINDRIRADIAAHAKIRPQKWRQLRLRQLAINCR